MFGSPGQKRFREPTEALIAFGTVAQYHDPGIRQFLLGGSQYGGLAVAARTDEEPCLSCASEISLAD